MNRLAGIYFAEVIKQFNNIETELGTVNQIADMIVDTILSGGHVFNYSRYETSLCYESNYRRGGLLLNRGIYAGENGPIGGRHYRDARVTGKDIVVMGIHQPDDPVDLKMLKAIRETGANVVSIGSTLCNGRIPDGETVPGQTDLHLGNMCDTYGLFAIPGANRKVCPTSGLLVTLMFYAVQMQIAEKIMERTGNTPRIDANVAMEGFWNKRRLDLDIIRKRGY